MRMELVGKVLTAVFVTTAVRATAGLGPLSNPEDQYRFIWDTAESVLPDLKAKGFNTAINGTHVKWDFAKDAPTPEFDSQVKALKSRMDVYDRLGIGFIQRFIYGWNKEAMELWPRVRKNGEKIKDQIDASEPKYLCAVERAIAEQMKELGKHPALVGTLTESEFRGFVEPSFTPRMAAAYKAYSGRDVPEGTDGRNPVPWRKRPDFPKDHVVPDDDPLLDFYCWQWRAGDGWTKYLDLVAETFAKGCGRPVLTTYDPVLRNLPNWGDTGTKLTHLNHWTYPYPEPYRVAYNLAELQAKARGTPGQKVLAMIQAISYLSVVAPRSEHPPCEPKWSRQSTNKHYCTTPPDIIQEAVWYAFSRQIDGVGFHGWNSLYHYDKPDVYTCTNDETIRTIGRLFNEVGVPLGPLFKAIPEREPEVAVLESCSSLVLGGAIWYSPHRYYSDSMVICEAANLSPYVLYEDEIKARGIPPSVKVLILPRCEVLTRTAYEKVADFQRRGGRLVADALLLPALKADATIPMLQEMEKNMQGDFDDGVVRKAQDAEVRNRAVKRLAAELKAAAKLEPYADSDNPDILVHARAYKSADYVFAINDRRVLGSYVGPWRRILEEGDANAGTVTVRRAAGAVYDLVRHAAVPFRTVGGKTEIPVSYETNDGRALLVTPAPLGALEVSFAGTNVVVTSADRDVLVPIRVDGLGPLPRYAVVKDGVWKGASRQEIDAVRVTNLATGEEWPRLAVSVDLTKPTGRIKDLNGVCNCPMPFIPCDSRGNGGVRYLGEIAELGSPYVRLHDTGGAYGRSTLVDIPNVFPNFEADEDDPKNYDFAFTDALLGAIVKAGAKPYYRLGVTIENYYRIKAYRIDPPKDPAKWARICEHVVRHYTKGWANGFRYDMPYWEVWCEPENKMLWLGDRRQFFDLYAHVAREIKRCHPEIRIGGYGACRFESFENLDVNSDDCRENWLGWFEEFCDYITADGTKAPLDFFSWHLYHRDPKCYVRHANDVRTRLDNHGLKSVEAHLTEWNHGGKFGLEAVRTVTGAVYTVSALCAFQRAPIDVATLYGAMPSSLWGSVFDQGVRPTPVFYALKSFSRLRKLGTAYAVTDDPVNNLYALAAGDGRDFAILVANNSLDVVRTIPVSLKGAAWSRFRMHRLDAAHGKFECVGTAPRDGIVTLPPKGAVLLTTQTE